MLFLSTVTLIISGCGGSSTTASSAGNSTTTGTGTSVATNNSAGTGGVSTQLTRAELNANANTICKRLHAQLLGLNRGSEKLDVEHVFLRAATAERAALAALQKLTPPSELAGDWKQIVATISTLAEDSAKYSEYTKAKNRSAISSMQHSYGPIKHQGIVVAARDGLGECGQAF
jgi:hypothetical protein